MPSSGNVLRFRTRAETTNVSPSLASAYAKAYLDAAPANETAEVLGPLGDADVLLSVCNLLRDQVNTSPAEISEKASRLHGWLVGTHPAVGFFDEREYFLGETALTAGAAFRLLGKRDETERWLDRADASFRHTLNPAASLARVAYVRLTLRFDMRRYDDVLELLPSVSLTFQKVGMPAELAKCHFLEAMALKDLGRDEEAKEKLEYLACAAEFDCENAIRGMALLNLGDLQGRAGAFEAALASYALANPLLQSTKRYIALADLKGMVGDTLQRMGRVDQSLAAYRESIQDYLSVGAQTRAAYLRVVLAQALLEAGRPNEAEWEIRHAIPVISTERMVPEGFAALSVLGEAVRQRKADPKALSELREYLQAKN
jgi:tetratricopeptide (TPR) repeat protein